MNALKADPRTVDLRTLAPHFYSLGVRILELFEEEEMVDILTDVSLLAGFASIELTMVCWVDIQETRRGDRRPRA